MGDSLSQSVGPRSAAAPAPAQQAQQTEDDPAPAQQTGPEPAPAVTVGAVWRSRVDQLCALIPVLATRDQIEPFFDRELEFNITNRFEDMAHLIKRMQADLQQTTTDSA